jgi:copper(I)-binding protein
MKRVIGIAIIAVAAVLAFVTLRSQDAPDHLTIVNAQLVLGAANASGGMLFFTVNNSGAPDALKRVTATGMAGIHPMASNTGDGSMPIPGGGTAIFAADGAHMMVGGLSGNFENGASVPMTLEFDQAGALTARAQVSIAGGDGGMAAMNHGASVMIDDGTPVPNLTLTVSADDAGYPVTLDTENFTFFTPPTGQDMAPHVPGEGHGHLYLNGVKLQRMYGPTARIGALLPGQYTITVTLNSNDHRTYMAGDGMVMATTELSVE